MTSSCVIFFVSDIGAKCVLSVIYLKYTRCDQLYLEVSGHDVMITWGRALPSGPEKIHQYTLQYKVRIHELLYCCFLLKFMLMSKTY
jgi:hypothetical protein